MHRDKKAIADIVPRLLRLRDASGYLGMDRNRFNREVRPWIADIRIGSQGIAFDRLDLDAWADQYKARNGRPGQRTGDQLWDARERQGSTNAKRSGISTNGSAERDFAKALERVISRKPKRS